MFLRSTKRACDECISRKVKCSGAWPCDACRNGPKRVNCTYFKPARKRGPKARRCVGPPSDSTSNYRRASTASTPAESVPRDGVSTERRAHSAYTWSQTIPQTIVAFIVRIYKRSSYNVWPVVNAEVLLQKLESGSHANNLNTCCLALALCAATMAQLQLAPLVNGDREVDSALMATECLRLREEGNFREHLDARILLVSFFLHVYHAKINKRNSAMLFLQEAISGARLLKLDGAGMGAKKWGADEDVITNHEILFTLLWVSERGYAIHLGLKPSYTSPIRLPNSTQAAENAHVQGLLELARLFTALDRVSARGSSSGCSDQTAFSAALTETEAALSAFSLGQSAQVSTRMADYCITKEWMRTIIWQEALSRHLLSSTSCVELMTFRFPAHVGRDLLCSLQGFSDFDLLPLGRDQLLKCFEVANCLADTVFCTSSVALYQSFHFGPQDFLHALYQKLLPFLEQDQTLKSVLHAKAANALVEAPARVLNLGASKRWLVEDQSDDNVDDCLDPVDNVRSATLFG